ncbi:MAG: glycine cleavage system aminomethyltransferase GcvT [bacterium]
MKETVFADIHRVRGARMIPFAGFNMPVEYTGIREEHLNVRENVGVFDVSHMGEIWVKGPNAKDLVQYLTSNDVNRLQPGKIQYSCFPNEQGGIVDDLLVYQYETDKYMLVVNAANIEKDWEWITFHNDKFGADIENASHKISQLAVQGPNAIKVLQKLTNTDLSSVKYYTFVTGNLSGVDNIIISATGYTGAGGFELYFYNDVAEQIWQALFEAGEEFNMKPAGLAARDTLRLEMGFCLHGNDINDTTSPLEAGLGWIMKFTDGNQFINREYFEQQKAEGIKKKLVGFEMLEKGIPRQHYLIQNLRGEEIGHVTSGTMSPSLKKGIGMGYVPVEYTTEGTEIRVEIRSKTLEAKVVKPPFIQK